jgi:hypothetical protein
MKEARLCVLNDRFEILHEISYRLLRHFGTTNGSFRLLFRGSDGESRQLAFNLAQVGWFTFCTKLFLF